MSEDLLTAYVNSFADRAIRYYDIGMPIKVQYHDGMPKLKVIEHGDWVDLYTEETVSLSKGDFELISLGVAMELPAGYEAIVAPRSSTFKKYGILMANSIGIIDNSYCGPDDIWNFPAYATRDIEIPKHSRICQFRIQKKASFCFQTVQELRNTNRGGIGEGTGDKIL